MYVDQQFFSQTQSGKKYRKSMQILYTRRLDLGEGKKKDLSAATYTG